MYEDVKKVFRNFKETDVNYNDVSIYVFDVHISVIQPRHLKNLFVYTIIQDFFNNESTIFSANIYLNYYKRLRAIYEQFSSAIFVVV